MSSIDQGKIPDLTLQDSYNTGPIITIANEDYKKYKHGIETGNLEDVRIAMANDVDINLLVHDKHPIVIVCSNGYWQILDLLLNSTSLNYDFSKLDSLLCIVAKSLKKDTFSERKSNFKLSFERLLEDSRVDINLTDYRGNTPLHYTVEYKCDDLTKSLLERGAYIGLKNLKKKLPIDGIDYKILHDFFDSRMKSNYDKQIRICNDFEINLDYSFLIKKPNRNNIFSQNTDQFYPIEFISQSEQLKDLILHPLIRYLIWMKYQALSLLFIWNIILFFIFLLTIIYITFYNYGNMEFEFYNQHKFIILITEYATLFCIFVIGAHIVVQFPILLNDFRVNSYMIWRFLNEFCILALLITVLLVSDKNQSDVKPILNLSNGTLSHLKPDLNFSTASDLKKQATAVCILLIAIDMNLLMITIPKFQKISVHFLMLQKISRQFLSVLLFYLIILFAFSLAFYVLDEHVNNTSIRTNINRLGEFFIRIIGMMIGELNLKFENLLIIYYILTLLFIFLITIVLINLLNGLAVTDVSEIRLKAKLIYLIYRLQLIVCYDKYFLRHIFMRKFIFSMFRCRRSLFFIRCLKLSLNQYVKEVTIFPNKGFTILTYISKPVEPDNVDEIKWRQINKNLLNELIEHFEKNMQETQKTDKDDELKTIMNRLIQRLDRIDFPKKERSQE